MRNVRRLLAAVLVLASACKDDNSSGSTSGGGAGLPTPPLWNDTSTAATGWNGDTPLLWNDPNTANTQFGVIDPSDVRTYTYPDIYILGNKHPLMTDVSARDFPVIVIQEDRITQLLMEYRLLEYERAIGIPRTHPSFPRAAFVAEFVDLRRNARAHAKHYALYHPTGALPLTNAEGDNILQPAGAPPPVTHVQVQPNNTTISLRNPTGRLIKSFIDVDQAGQLVASGTTLGIPDRVFTQWVTNHRPFLLRTNWTHLGVGYWSSSNSTELHYWNAVYAENPRALVPTQTIPILFFP